MNYNLYSIDINFNVRNKDCELFLGPNYYVLNPSFKKYKNYKRSFSSKARYILLTMGGGDPMNLTIKIAKALVGLKNIHLNIVLGKLYNGLSQIERLQGQFPKKISIFKNINNMHEMMAKNDLIIGTGGNTSFEAAYMGLPGVLINQIDLQELNGVKYEENGIFKNLGLGENVSKYEIKKSVQSLIEDEKTRRKFSYNGKNLVKADGIDVIIEKFIN